jgi:ATPases involved in chromosome partitioning
VLLSGKASPGTTASTWALGFGWTGQVLLVDADAQGGDLAPGLLLGRSVIDRGVWSWSAATRKLDAEQAAAALIDHALRLPEAPGLLLLPGFQHGEQARGIDHAGWNRLASALSHVSATSGCDVLIDTGRVVPGMAWPLACAADKVLLVARRTGRSAHWARNATVQLAEHLGDLARVGLLLIGDGPYPVEQVAAAVGVPVFGRLPRDPATAAVFTDGAPVRVRGLHRTPLLRAAGELASQLAGLGYAARVTSRARAGSVR